MRGRHTRTQREREGERDDTKTLGRYRRAEPHAPRETTAKKILKSQSGPVATQRRRKRGPNRERGREGEREREKAREKVEKARQKKSTKADFSISLSFISHFHTFNSKSDCLANRHTSTHCSRRVIVITLSVYLYLSVSLSLSAFFDSQALCSCIRLFLRLQRHLL